MGGTKGNRVLARGHRLVAFWAGWQKCATQRKQVTFVVFGDSWERCDNVVMELEFGSGSVVLKFHLKTVLPGPT